MARRASLSGVVLTTVLLGTTQCKPAAERPQATPNTTAAATAPTDSLPVSRRDSAPDSASNAAAGVADLGGTSWRLVKFEGGDGTIRKPTAGAEYSIAFGTDGRLSARIDCNRGGGTWKSSGPPQLELGPLALTRMACPPGSLHDQIVEQWPNVRSYVMRGGHLFLSLMADGGIYEFEPASGEAKVEAAVRGTATYRERMALPPGAVFQATLEDVSRADAAAIVIGETRVEQPGNPPIRFELRYDSSHIDPSHRYAVRARITVDDQAFFTTAQPYPVLTAGAGHEVQLLLLRAGASGTADGAVASPASLEDTYWKLTQIGDAPVPPPAQGREEPHLMLDSKTHRVNGSGGCNRLAGTYALDGNRLTFGRSAATLMACPDGMEAERAFFRVLGHVRGWRVAARRLELLDASGTMVARFEARHSE
jgi:putative lipoprotein